MLTEIAQKLSDIAQKNWSMSEKNPGYLTCDCCLKQGFESQLFSIKEKASIIITKVDIA